MRYVQGTGHFNSADILFGNFLKFVPNLAAENSKLSSLWTSPYRNSPCRERNRLGNKIITTLHLAREEQ